VSRARACADIPIAVPIRWNGRMCFPRSISARSHETEHLVPLTVPQRVLIVDDHFHSSAMGRGRQIPRSPEDPDLPTKVRRSVIGLMRQ
jgi:hypothetical protein